jgi:hypothetical protein
MQIKRATLLTAMVLTVVFLLTACDGLSSKQESAASDALKSLRKVEAATQVGVSYMQYNSQLIEAQTQVNEASRELPDGDLKREIQATMEAYTDAGRVWNRKIQGDVTLWANDSESKALMQRYKIQASPIRFETGVVVGNGVKADVALQKIWSEARAHLDRASSLNQ